MSVSKETLEQLRKVRTSDIADALDTLGMQQRYEMDPEMRPLTPGTQFCGIALTHEYEVIDDPLPEMTYEYFDEYQYKNNPDGTRSDEALWKPAGDWGEPDQVLVIDAKRQRTGILGSNNTLRGKIRGAVGFVIDGSCRDSDECAAQGTPVFMTVRTMAHPAGRIRAVSAGQEITCGGVKVRTGDVISADGDGVIVVPAELAEEVASRALRVQQKDRKVRLEYYRQLGWPLDESVKLDD